MKKETHQKTCASQHLKQSCQDSELRKSVPLEFQNHLFRKQATEAIAVKTNQTENLKQVQIRHVLLVEHRSGNQSICNSKIISKLQIQT